MKKVKDFIIGAVLITGFILVYKACVSDKATPISQEDLQVVIDSTSTEEIDTLIDVLEETKE